MNPRGFALLTAEQRAAVSSKGGKAAHALGRAHKWDQEAARAAGRKGGLVSSGRSKVKREEIKTNEPA